MKKIPLINVLSPIIAMFLTVPTAMGATFITNTDVWSGGSDFDDSTSPILSNFSGPFLLSLSSGFQEVHSHGGALAAGIEVFDVNLSSWVSIQNVNLNDGGSFSYSNLAVLNTSTLTFNQVRLVSDPDQFDSFHSWFSVDLTFSHDLSVISPESYAGFADYGTQSIKSYTTAALNMPGYTTGGSVRIPVGSASASKMSAMSSLKPTTSVFAGYSHYDTGTASSINGADYDITSDGGVAGVRHEIDRFTIGGFFAIDDGDIKSVSLDADAAANLFGAFASYLIKPEMNLIVTGGITYGDYEFSGTRQSLGPVTFGNVASEVYDIHLGIEGDAYSAEKVRVSPFLGFHYISSNTDAFNETGFGALSVDAQSEDAFFSEIGIKAEYDLNQQLSLNGNISYTNNLSNTDKNVGASLGGTPFAVSSPGLGNDFFTVGIGAQYLVNEAISLGINYRAEISSDAETANGVNVSASYSF